MNLSGRRRSLPNISKLRMHSGPQGKHVRGLAPARVAVVDNRAKFQVFLPMNFSAGSYVWEPTSQGGARVQAARAGGISVIWISSVRQFKFVRFELYNETIFCAGPRELRPSSENDSVIKSITRKLT